MNELDAIIDAAREAVATGAPLDVEAYEERIREAAIDDDIADAALTRLRRLLALQRSRATLAAEPPSPPTRPRARAAYRARPTISANMDVRREGESALAWDAAAGLTWEVRLSERPDARSEYVVRETLRPEQPRIELPLGELPLRVHILGHDRRGKLVRRAVVSGLTREGWRDRWIQRASAS